jgi:hypothetical protein
MTARPLSLATRMLLQKLANDTGVDVEHVAEDPRLPFNSTRAPMRLWLSVVGDTVVAIAISQHNVVEALKGQATPLTKPLPPGAARALGATAFQAAQKLVRRAYALSRTLPDELLHVFRTRTTGLPAGAAVERPVGRAEPGQGTTSARRQRHPFPDAQLPVEAHHRGASILTPQSGCGPCPAEPN